jgi:hypothetical protein
MRSMRSVIMNPPTTLMVAAVTATRPKTVAAREAARDHDRSHQ